MRGIKDQKELHSEGYDFEGGKSVWNDISERKGGKKDLGRLQGN